jgi:PAS domain-containing protein
LATGEARILGKRIDLSALRADQTMFPIELTITQIEMPDGPMFTAFIRDTTERKRAADERDRAAEALRTSEYRFRTLARQAPVGIIAVDLEGRCIFVNERWCKMAGMNSGQAMERGWQELGQRGVLACYRARRWPLGEKTARPGGHEPLVERSEIWIAPADRHCHRGRR